jgi:hypothetical protein
VQFVARDDDLLGAFSSLVLSPSLCPRRSACRQ